VRFPVLIVLIAFLSAAAGGLLAATTLDLDADTNSLIADDRPFMKTYRAFLDEFGDLEYLYVVVDAGTPPDKETAQAAVHELVTRLRANADLPGVYGEITGNDQWRLAPRAMELSELQGLLDASDAFAPLLANETPTAILQQADEALAQLLSGGLTMAEDKAKRLGARSLFLLEAITAAPPSARDAQTEFALAYPRAPEYLTSDTGRMYFIEIMPHKDFGSLAVIEKPLEEIRATMSEVQALHPAISIGLTGKPVLQADELATTQVDMTRASIVALAIISILFMIVFRGVRRPVLAVLAFAAAFGWTYGVAALLVGRLNLLSMVFMLVLVGVGLDYGVHTVARWNEARRRMRAHEAVQHVMQTAVVGNMTGALISAGVFLLALLTAFQGLRELGTIAGIGLLLCVLAMTFILPALLFLTERNRGVETDHPSSRAASNKAVGFLASARRPFMLIALVLAAIVSVLFVFIVPERINFESNLLKLQATGLESVEWEHRLFEDDTSASWFAAVIVDSIQDIPPVVEKAKQEPEVGRILSALDLVAEPSEERAILREAFARAADPPSETTSDSPDLLDPKLLSRVEDRVRTLASFARGRAPDADIERMHAIADRLKAQHEVLSGGDGIHAVNMQSRLDAALANTANAIRQMGFGARGTLRESLPGALRARFVSPGGRFLILLQPAENIWEYAPMASFVAAIRDIDPDATGVPITQFESMNDMANAFTTMAIGAVFVVGCLIWLDFRSISATLFCMGSLAMGLLWTIGALALGDIPINLANFFAIPILVGLSASGSIHIMHRWRQMQSSGETRYGATIRAVTLTACTTGIGFGALLFARHKGLESLGWVMAIGSLACLLTAVLVLPILLEIAPDRLRKRLRGVSTSQ
jgi:hypothetical protein